VLLKKVINQATFGGDQSLFKKSLDLQKKAATCAAAFPAQPVWMSD
jgi:hypothetical protein